MTNVCAACGAELPGPAPHHPCPAFDDFWAERPRDVPPAVKKRCAAKWCDQPEHRCPICPTPPAVT